MATVKTVATVKDAAWVEGKVIKAIRDQEAYAATHDQVDKVTGLPFKGLLVLGYYGPTKGVMFCGNDYTFIAALEATLTEAKIAVTPYSYADKTPQGTAVDFLKAMRDAGKIAIRGDRTWRILGPEEINATNGKAVKVKTPVPTL